MRLQNPVADVDDVDVLFDDDVARKSFIVHPVAETEFLRRSFGPLGAIDIAGEIVSFPADDFAECACMDAANHFNERRTITDLEPDIETELAVDAFSDIDDF